MNIEKIQENERIFFTVLAKNSGWETFYRIANKINQELGIVFKDKVDDFDCKYWHFDYNEIEFILHFHEMICDIEIFVKKPNNPDSLKKLILELRK